MWFQFKSLGMFSWAQRVWKSAVFSSWVGVFLFGVILPTVPHKILIYGLTSPRNLIIWSFLKHVQLDYQIFTDYHRYLQFIYYIYIYIRYLQRENFLGSFQDSLEFWATHFVIFRVGYLHTLFVSMTIYIYIYNYIRATPGFCPGVAAYICPIHEQMMLQITIIPMGKVTQILETIKQTRSKQPKFLWEKQKRHNTCNSYGKNNKGTNKF